MAINLESSLKDFRHELLVKNFKGIPVLQQHGDADDNVPVYHARRLRQLICQAGVASSASYVELPGKGHWYEGVMSTKQLKDFYHRCLADGAQLPMTPQSFEFVVASPSDTGPRGGLSVDKIFDPIQLGRLELKCVRALRKLQIETSNIRRISFLETSHLLEDMEIILLDGEEIKADEIPEGELRQDFYLVKDGYSWSVSEHFLCIDVSFTCSGESRLSIYAGETLQTELRLITRDIAHKWKIQHPLRYGRSS